MPLSLKDRRKVTRTVTVHYDGETVDVTYRPGMVSSQTNQDARESNDTAFNAEWISRVVAEWDVIAEDGKTKLAPTVENAQQIESPFLTAVMVAVYEDMRPNARSGSGSSGG